MSDEDVRNVRNSVANGQSQDWRGFEGNIRKFVSVFGDSQFGLICLKIRQKVSRYVGDAYFLVN